MARNRPMLFDANGRPMALSTNTPLPPWKGVGTGRRARDWTATGTGINALLASNLNQLTRRSRQAVRDDVYASAAIDAVAVDAVGTGLCPIPDVADDEVRQEILDLWRIFVMEADADGAQSLYGQQHTVMRETKEAGECFGRLRFRRSSDGLAVPLQIELLPSEMLDSSLNTKLSRRRVIKNGIEFDTMGRRVAYHFFREHPGEKSDTRSFGARELTRVPAARVVHVFPILRAGQIRGVPGLAVVIAKLKDISDAGDAFIERAHVQNLYNTFETIPAEDSNSFLDYQDGEDDSSVVDEYGVPERGLQPGGHVLLPPGHSIEFGTPNVGSLDFYAMMKAELHAVAAGAGTTYEKMTTDISDVNFSSIRAGLISLYRKLEVLVSNTLEFQFCRPIWREFVLQAQLVGAIDVPSNEREQRKLLNPRWITTPGREYVDPEKEVRAAILAIRAGIVPRSTVVMEYSGMDIGELERVNQQDRDRAERFGNAYTTEVPETTASDDGASAPGAGTSPKPLSATN